MAGTRPTMPTLTHGAHGMYKDTLARRLFAGMRALDEAGVDIILCPLPPEDGVGLALRDRLRKAARTK